MLVDIEVALLGFSPGFKQPSSDVPLQLSSIVFPQISISPGLMFTLASLQSVVFAA